MATTTTTFWNHLGDFLKSSGHNFRFFRAPFLNLLSGFWKSSRRIFGAHWEHFLLVNSVMCANIQGSHFSPISKSSDRLWQIFWAPFGILPATFSDSSGHNFWITRWRPMKRNRDAMRPTFRTAARNLFNKKSRFSRVENQGTTLHRRRKKA